MYFDYKFIHQDKYSRLLLIFPRDLVLPLANYLLCVSYLLTYPLRIASPWDIIGSETHGGAKVFVVVYLYPWTKVGDT